MSILLFPIVEKLAFAFGSTVLFRPGDLSTFLESGESGPFKVYLLKREAAPKFPFCFTVVPLRKGDLSG